MAGRDHDAHVCDAERRGEGEMRIRIGQDTWECGKVSIEKIVAFIESYAVIDVGRKGEESCIVVVEDRVPVRGS